MCVGGWVGGRVGVCVVIAGGAGKSVVGKEGGGGNFSKSHLAIFPLSRMMDRQALIEKRANAGPHPTPNNGGAGLGWAWAGAENGVGQLTERIRALNGAGQCARPAGHAGSGLG